MATGGVPRSFQSTATRATRANASWCCTAPDADPGTQVAVRRLADALGASGTSVTFLGILFGTGTYIIDVANDIFSSSGISAASENDTGATGLYPQVLTLITVATLGLLAIRTVGRALMDQIHLVNDAYNRSSAAKTFLAMIDESDQPIKDNERILMLQALFQFKDTRTPEDGFASSIADLISKRILKGKS